jgi:hypothetical protein
MVRNPEQQLAALFRETGLAHHRAFADTNGDDPDWPDWYAQYLLPRLQELLGRPFDLQTVARDLRAMDADHRGTDAHEPWPEFYARSFPGRYAR